MDLLDAAISARTRTRALLLAFSSVIAVLLGAIVGQLFLAPLVGALTASLPDTTIGASTRQLIYLVAGFSPVYLLLALMIRVREKRSFSYLFRAPRKGILATCITGIVIGTAMSTAPILLGVLKHTIIVRPTDHTPGLYFSFFLGILALLFQTFAEEIVFRGWLLPLLKNSFISIAALMLSSLMFTAAHTLNPNVTGIQIFSLFVAAIVLGLLTLATRNIWAAGFAHAFWNWVQYQGIALDAQQPLVGALFVASNTEGGPAFGGGELESTGEFAVCILVLLVAVRWATHGRFIGQRAST